MKSHLYARPQLLDGILVFMLRTHTIVCFLWLTSATVPMVRANVSAPIFTERMRFFYEQGHLPPRCLVTLLKAFQGEGMVSFGSVITKSVHALRISNLVDRQLGSRTFRSTVIGQSSPEIKPLHHLAFAFADMIRYLPEWQQFYGRRYGRELDVNAVDHEFLNFLTLVPEGFELIREYTGPVTGLKYGLFKNQRAESSDQPDYVMAFAPTQDLDDWLANMSYGIDQILHPEIDRVVDAVLGVRPRNLLITGHSLGGGLSQGFAYRLQKKAAAQGMDLPSSVVTFNAFGALDQIKWFERNLDTSVLDRIRSAHYYVAGDPVAALSEHVGRFEDSADASLQETLLRPTINLGRLNTIGWRVHGIDALQKAIANSKDPNQPNQTRVAQISPLRMGRLAKYSRMILLAYQQARLGESSHQVAKHVAELRRLFVRSGLRYGNWLANEVEDMHAYFVSIEDHQGQEILEPLLSLSP